jgi:Ca-activated chloride channel family protein
LAEVPGAGLKRVILLSDGQANEGLTDPAAIAAQCAEQAALGITTSTYGLGHNFNEELMVAMGRAGGGNPYYGDTAEDLMEPFEQEFELLRNLLLRELRLEVRASDGVSVEVLNGFQAAGVGWRLPDLAWGSEAWALMRLTVPAVVLPRRGSHCSLLRVSVSGCGPAGDAVQLERSGLSLPVVSAAEAASLASDALVERRLAELEAADTLAAMRAAAGAGDWQRVDALLLDAQRRFAGNAWVESILGAMQAMAANREQARTLKEALYASAKLRHRLSAKDEDARIVGDRAEEPAYLRRKPEQGKAGR